MKQTLIILGILLISVVSAQIPKGGGGGGGGAGSLTLIQTQTLGAPAATVTFSAIPATYTHLTLSVLARTSSTAANLAIRFNNDTAANYAGFLVQGQSNSGATTAPQGFTNASATSIVCANLPPSTALANAAGSVTIDIVGYAQTTFMKTIQSRSSQVSAAAFTGVGSMDLVEWMGYWNNTATINRVDLLSTVGNFVTGSIFSLYGIS